jgi:hypothetical protein
MRFMNERASMSYLDYADFLKSRILPLLVVTVMRSARSDLLKIVDGAIKEAVPDVKAVINNNFTMENGYEVLLWSRCFLK